MQLSSHPAAVVPTPIVIPSAPILPEQRLVFGASNAPDPTKPRNPPEEPPSKKRRKDRACDYCRRRKIKCDGPWRQGQVCTNCLHSQRRCTYIESSKPRGPPKAYVTSLEDKIERLEGILKQLCPDTDFSEELGPPIARGSWRVDKHEEYGQEIRSVQQTSSTSLSILKQPLPTATLNRDHDFPMSQPERTTHLIFDPPRHPTRRATGRKSPSPWTSVSDSSDSVHESDEDTIDTSIGGRHKYALSAMENDDELVDSCIRFHGRSSTAGLVEVTRRFKRLCMEERDGQTGKNDQGYGVGNKATILPRHKTAASKPDNTELQAFRRIEFWCTAKWELAWNTHNSHAPSLITEVLKYFPPDPVANELVDLFFLHTNPYLPLLHRPTFERYWHEGLHHDNIWFATQCILIFAVASRWYDSGGEALRSWLHGGEHWKAVGWKWFFVALDVHCLLRSLSCPATLLEIQTFALLVIFLRGTTCLPTAWLFVSIGLRKAQDRGAHRRAVYRTYPNPDDELWKRAFWILLAFDHILGASLGRGIATGQEDYDLDFPLEVDDEYWETGNAETDFKQPPDTPSKLSCFIQFLKLAEIIAFTAKTLYPVDKRRVFLGFVQGNWTGEVVRQLKMAMEEFTHKIPPHLQWNENDPDSVFTRQAATVHSLFHLIMMTQWRPFCAYNPSTTPQAENRQSVAMSKCAISIKACGRILGVELHRGLSNTPMLINACLVCAGTLAIILWVLQKKMVASGKGKTQIRNFEIEKTGIYIYELLDAVDICMKILELKQSSWEYAEAVVEQLKAALPSDRDESFEALDIPVPPVQGISDMMRTPGHLGDGSTPPFEIPPDATFSFMSRNYYQLDSLQPIYTQTTEAAKAVRHTDSLPSLSDIDVLSRTHHRRINAPVPFNHTSSDRPFSISTTAQTNNPAPLKGGRRTLHMVGQHAEPPPPGFIPYPSSAASRLHLQLSHDQPSLSTTEDRSMPSHLSRPVPTVNPEMFGPKTSSVTLPSRMVDTTLPFERSIGEQLQLKFHHAARTRTTSLVEKPTSYMEAKREIPCISNLRRTSFPNLQASKRDNFTGPLGSQSNRSSPNFALDDSYDIVQPTLDGLSTRFQPPSHTPHRPWSPEQASIR